MATSSASSSAAAAKEISFSDAAAVVVKGGRLVKHGRKGRPHPREFLIKQLDTADAAIHWGSDKKNPEESSVKFRLVKELRLGQKTRIFERNHNAKTEPYSFSLLYTDNGEDRSLDIECPNEEEFHAWTTVIRNIMARFEGKSGDPVENWLKDRWAEADTNKDNNLSFNEIVKLLPLVNCTASKDYVKKIFKDVDTDNSDNLSFEEFVKFFQLLSYRADADALFQQYASDGKHLTTAELLKFMQTEQKETNAKLEDAHALIKHHEHTSVKDGMSRAGFQSYLDSTENGAVPTTMATEISQDMTHPLSHYFIASSHNTYLIGDQLKGQSSVEGYINALLAGCRCVELDCWDGPDGDPIIYHGHTLTTKIKFRDVIECIRDYAFKASPYPVILSLENHCSLEQQVRMAHHMKTLLGDHLADQLIDSTKNPALPSPEQLKHKILVKGKMAPSDHTTTAPAGTTDVADEQPGADGDKEEDSEDSEDDEKEAPAAGAAAQAEPEKKKKHKAKSVAPELSVMVFNKAVHFKSFEKSKTTPAWEMSSFAEAKLAKLCEHHPTEFVAFHTRQLSRIYPAGFRVDSSNYSPIQAWNHGAQIVALNYQTHDAPMQYNTGRFSMNGGCGYVLKPPAMCAGTFDPRAPTGTPLKLMVTVVSGRQLPKPPSARKGEVIDPFVVVEIVGVPQDTKKFETKWINDNGFNPRWNTQFAFSVSAPELALIRLAVFDHDVGGDDFIGYACFPVSCLREGVRAVALRGTTGQMYDVAALTCKFEFA